MAMTNTFRNPILPGFNPDPSICHVSGKGFFVTTSSFEFFPGLPIYHSTNLVEWKVSQVSVSSLSTMFGLRTTTGSSSGMLSTDEVKVLIYALSRLREASGRQLSGIIRGNGT
jgi:beta-xylosidase